MSTNSARGENAAVKSPCINVCVLNGFDICTGCFRSSKEIQGWPRMDNDERRQTLERSWKRARAAGNVL